MNKKHFAMALVLPLSLVTILSGCGSSAEKPAASGGAKSTDAAKPAESGKNLTLKYSTPAPANSAQVKAMNAFKDAIEKSSNGQIKVQIYASSSLVGQDAELASLERGTLDMANVSAAQVSQKFPAASMFTAAYTFKNYDAMTKILNGDIGKKFFKDISDKTGLIPISAWYNGSRELNYRDIGHDIKTPNDMKGMKLRMPNAKAWLELGKSLGANPVPLAFAEVYTSLQTGTIDGQDNPLNADKDNKFYEVAKNISLTNHVVDSLWPAVNKKVWGEMGPDLQKKMADAIEVGRQVIDKETQQQESELVDFFKQNGVKIIQPDNDAFRVAAQKYYKDNKDATQGWDMNLYDQVQKFNDSLK